MKLQPSEQIGALKLALAHVTDWSVAIDGGANKGEWSSVLSKHFWTIHAFEPAPDMAKVLRDRFIKGVSPVVVHEAALWASQCTVTLCEDARYKGKSRARYVKPGGGIPAVSIDSLKLEGCGLIKLDIEGAEPFALQGARETIRKFRPVVIVERKNFPGRYHCGVEETQDFLNEMGLACLAAHGPDRIYGWT